MEFNKQQWNDIFRVLTEQGLSPDLFERCGEPAQPQYGIYAVPGLHVKGKENLKFVCKMEGQVFYYHYYPSQENTVYNFNTRRWGEVVSHVALWASCVKAELEAPDLWRAVGNAGEAWQRINWNGTQDDHFTGLEVERISAALDEIKHLVARHLGLNARQVKDLNEKMEGLKNGLSEIKRGWFMPLLLGILIQLIVPLQLAQDRVHAAIAEVGQRVADCIVIESTPTVIKPSIKSLPK